MEVIMLDTYKIIRNDNKCSVRKDLCEDLSALFTNTRINWLIGAGFSASVLSTLGNNEILFETLENRVYSDETERKKTILKAYMYWNYFCDSIYPITSINSTLEGHLEEYIKFASELHRIISKRDSSIYSKRINVFTTNYDPILELAFDKTEKLLYNDGFEGRIYPYFSTDNYSKKYYREAMFSNRATEIPVIDIFKIHGSVTWKRVEERIEYQYYNEAINTFFITLSGLFDKKKRKQIYYLSNPRELNRKIIDEFDLDALLKTITTIQSFSTEDSGKDMRWYYPQDQTDILIEQILDSLILDDGDVDKYSDFYQNYTEFFSIVNPTKGKFKDTLMNKNYYELLRLFSNELEKENTTLLSFGFSFNDEHILDLVKRSMINPNLKIIIFCYKESEIKHLKEIFSDSKNDSISYVCYKNKDDSREENTFSIKDLSELLSYIQ